MQFMAYLLSGRASVRKVPGGFVRLLGRAREKSRNVQIEERSENFVRNGFTEQLLRLLTLIFQMTAVVGDCSPMP